MKSKFKIISIVGTRPNIIKAAPVSKALAEEGCFDEVIVHTGQHYDYNLSEAFFNELQLPAPKYNLEIGSGRQAWQLGLMIAGLDTVIEKEAPNLVLVFGDSNTTAAGAVAAAKNNIPVAHIEAGLREFDKQIPEEVNKLITDSIADIYFCPTPTAVKLLNESGIINNVHHVGDVGIDLIHMNMERIKAAEKQVLGSYGLLAQKYYFVTCHRAANTDNAQNLKEILDTLHDLQLPFVFPLHPRTRLAIEENGFQQPNGLVNPLGFFETQALIRNAKAVITDSGGVIKEAYYHKTPGVIIDKQTEWIETVEEGWNRIAGPVKARILELLQSTEVPLSHSNCLGEGDACIKIAKILREYLEQKELAASNH